MFESIMKFFNKLKKKEEKTTTHSKEAAKERLHLVLMQDRANVSADFLELMKQEIIEVIKKYIDIDEGAIDVRLTNKENEDGTNGAPALYANIPILNIKNEARKMEKKDEEPKDDEHVESKNQEQETEKEKKQNEQEDVIKNEQQNDKTEEKDEDSEEQIEDKKENENQDEDEKDENIELEKKEKVAEEKIKSK